MKSAIAKARRFLESRGPSRLRPRSSVRGPWLTSVFGLVLLIGLPVVIITGLLSYIAYGPQFGQAMPGNVRWLHLPYFDWPTRPSWLYRLTQGLHVGLGLILIPVVLAKLWSVIPKLFVFPPVRTPAQALERLSLIALVGGILFEIITGVLNIQYNYIFGFSFYTAHYWGAWVFIAGFVTHTIIKVPTMIKSLRSRSKPEAPEDSDLVAQDPAPTTISRRGVLAVVGGGAALVALLTVGQTIGGVFRPTALLLPRGRSINNGPNGFQINRTAAAAQITDEQVADTWQLSLLGGAHPLAFTRAQLLALPQHDARLPIACVEGWSTTENWRGVRLRDLAALAGVPAPTSAAVTSLERGGPFSFAVLQGNQATHPDALLALQVNGVDLSLDHGFPARIIVPALPGVHNTKWVQSIEFRGA